MGANYNTVYLFIKRRCIFHVEEEITAIADHQGNTRVVFTSTAPVAQSKTATFETPASETGNFNNYPTSGKLNTLSINNKTTGGTNSYLLNGGYNGVVGLAKSYKVYPGDQVKIDAYAMFRNLSGNQSQLSGFASAILSAFGLSASAAGETGTAAAGLQTWGALAAGGYGDGSNDNTDPKAFVNIILFDKNYNFLDVAYAQLKGTAGNYTLLSANYTVKKEGYAYVYISNENATAVDVYFDDITMTYTPTNVIQYNEYYPFGLQTADSWTRSNASNNFLYNEASELNQTSGFYDLPFRNYDASLGRFFQVDPLSYQDNAASPFAYAGNNPVVFNDPQGLMVSAAGLSDYQLRMMYRRDMASYLSYDDWASQNIIEYAAGKGFDNMNGSGGSTWGSWSSTPIFGLVQGRKPRYETEGYDYMELGIVGYQWSYTPGNGGSPFDQVMGDPAVSSAGSPIGEWGGSEAQQGGLKFSTLWNDYGSDLSHTDKDGNELFDNYCAINLSEALIKSGMSPGGTKCWGTCSSDKKHTIRAQELADWLLGNLSGAKDITGENFMDQIEGKTGIVFFQNYYEGAEGGMTGDHIDLWNKNEMGTYGVFDTWLRTTIPWLATLKGMSDLSKSTQILFWEIK